MISIGIEKTMKPMRIPLFLIEAMQSSSLDEREHAIKLIYNNAWEYGGRQYASRTKAYFLASAKFIVALRSGTTLKYCEMPNRDRFHTDCIYMYCSVTIPKHEVVFYAVVPIPRG